MFRNGRGHPRSHRTEGRTTCLNLRHSTLTHTCNTYPKYARAWSRDQALRPFSSFFAPALRLASISRIASCSSPLRSAVRRRGFLRRCSHAHAGARALSFVRKAARPRPRVAPHVEFAIKRRNRQRSLVQTRRRHLHCSRARTAALRRQRGTSCSRLRARCRSRSPPTLGCRRGRRRPLGLGHRGRRLFGLRRRHFALPGPGSRLTRCVGQDLFGDAKVIFGAGPGPPTQFP